MTRLTSRWLLAALMLAQLGAFACGKVGPPLRAPQYREGYVPPLDSQAGETELEEDEQEEEVLP